jgi:hypothetical protein
MVLAPVERPICTRQPPHSDTTPVPAKSFTF